MSSTEENVCGSASGVAGTEARPADVLLALADRCEREEPSQELNIAIFVASGLINEAHCTAWCNQDGRKDLTRERYIAAWAPNFCTCLDAAVTLEPADAQEVCVRKYPGGGMYVRLTTAAGSPVYSLVTNRPVTEPMARLAAYLRARAALTKAGV